LIHKIAGAPPIQDVVPVLQGPQVQATPPDFDEIFAEHGRFVWRIVARLGVPAADVPDVCQDVFVTVYRKLATFDGRAPFRSWLYGICARTASEYRRRVRTRKETAADTIAEHQILPSQDEHIARAQARARLQSALDELDEEKRAVFVLYELEELSMKEIAEVLQCPLQTAYSRLHAARKLVSLAFRRMPIRGVAR
jgi:RNA polymerase sigma-70 factor, ECF subfamily